METNDVINGIFEMFGAYVTWKNAFKLKKDKQVRGVYWKIWIFYSLWGCWNLHYYPSLDQWVSFYAGIIMVAGNFYWVYLAYKYRKSVKNNIGKKIA